MGVLGAVGESDMEGWWGREWGGGCVRGEDVAQEGVVVGD